MVSGGNRKCRPKIFSFGLLPSTIRFNIIHPWVRHSNFSYFVNHIHNIYFTLVQSIGVKLLTSIFPCQFIRILVVMESWVRGCCGKNRFVRNIQRIWVKWQLKLFSFVLWASLIPLPCIGKTETMPGWVARVLFLTMKEESRFCHLQVRYSNYVELKRDAWTHRYVGIANMKIPL